MKSGRKLRSLRSSGVAIGGLFRMIIGKPVQFPSNVLLPTDGPWQILHRPGGGDRRSAAIDRVLH
jgi:hypothetical protein